jgi:glycosyltransferase involved in cell wall biosynthesis
MDVIDPWPDIFEKVVPDQLAFIPKLFFQPQKHKLRQTLKNINQLTAISHQYLDWAKSYYTPIASTECLYPAADYHKIRELIEENKTSDKERDENLNVIYAGSLASSYDIKCILEAAEQLAGKPIHFYIAGAGEQEEAIKAYTQKRDNLMFLGRLPKDRLMSYYAHADLGLTQHVKGATQSVTYKLFDLLSAGLPVLNSLESEMKDIILDNKVGLHNDPGDSKQLAENIAYFYNNPTELEQYKANGLELARNVGDTRVIYNRFVDLLEENANL